MDRQYQRPELNRTVNVFIRPELFGPPEILPKNIQLVTADLLGALPTEWNERFDLVHQRFVCPNFTGDVMREILGRLMACVKPGGWIQLVEPCAGENISGPGPQWFSILHKLSNLFMASAVPRDTILSILDEAGFVNINIESQDIVIGKHQSDRELDSRGRKSMRDAVTNMYPMTR